MKYVLKINNMYLSRYNTDLEAIYNNFISYISFTNDISISFRIIGKENAEQLANQLEPLLNISLNVVEYKGSEE